MTNGTTDWAVSQSSPHPSQHYACNKHQVPLNSSDVCLLVQAPSPRINLHTHASATLKHATTAVPCDCCNVNRTTATCTSRAYVWDSQHNQIMIHLPTRCLRSFPQIQSYCTWLQSALHAAVLPAPAPAAAAAADPAAPNYTLPAPFSFLAPAQ